MVDRLKLCRLFDALDAEVRNILCANPFEVTEAAKRLEMARGRFSDAFSAFLEDWHGDAPPAGGDREADSTPPPLRIRRRR